MAKQAAVITAGLGLGLSNTQGIVGLGVVAVTLGVLLTAAFRSTPGAMAAMWHRLHSRDPLYKVYARVGPYTWRFGAAVIAAASHRLVV